MPQTLPSHFLTGWETNSGERFPYSFPPRQESVRECSTPGDPSRSFWSLSLFPLENLIFWLSPGRCFPFLLLSAFTWSLCKQNFSVCNWFLAFFLREKNHWDFLVTKLHMHLPWLSMNTALKTKRPSVTVSVLCTFLIIISVSHKHIQVNLTCPTCWKQNQAFENWAVSKMCCGPLTPTPQDSNIQNLLEMVFSSLSLEVHFPLQFPVRYLPCVILVPSFLL